MAVGAGIVAAIMAAPAKLVVVTMIVVYPVLVPLFALLFPAVGVDLMWKLEHFIYLLHDQGRLPYLFQHLARVDRKTWDSTYGVHALCGGIALLAIYWQMWKVFRIGSKGWTKLRLPPHILCGAVYLACSTVMAWRGVQLVPGMYANDLGKLWTHRQAVFILCLNALIAVSGGILACCSRLFPPCLRAAGSGAPGEHPKEGGRRALLRVALAIHISSGIVSATFMFFVGVVERFLVQFVYPMLPGWVVGGGEESYKALYSLHFPVCAFLGVACGLWLSWAFYARRRSARPASQREEQCQDAVASATVARAATGPRRRTATAPSWCQELASPVLLRRRSGSLTKP